MATWGAANSLLGKEVKTMVSRYSIIQYVPDPIADERINIGAIAFDEQLVQVHFLSRWNRVSRFAPVADVSFLRDFARQMNQVSKNGLLFPGDRPNGLPNHERLTQLSQAWMNSIQFTEPRGSLADVETLLADIVKSYLVEPPPKTKKLRDRQAAAQIAKTRIRTVLKRMYKPDKAKELFRDSFPLSGSHKKHKFDVTVANGRPFFAAHGVSFEIQTPEQTLDSLAFMITDVKESNPNFPLAVVALPPTARSLEQKRLQDTYQQMVATYQGLGATVIEENQVETWASEQLKQMGI